MYITIAVIAAAAIGLTLRLSWAKVVTDGELYRVPLFWVVLMFIITLATSPKSTAFLLGIFCIDIIGSIAKDKEEDKKTFSKILNWLMDLIPLQERKKDVKDDINSS